MGEMTDPIKGIRKAKDLFIESLLSWDAVDLAYYYVRGAGENEKKLLKEIVLPKASQEYFQEFNKYKENPDLFDIDPELKKRFSGLENRT